MPQSLRKSFLRAYFMLADVKCHTYMLGVRGICLRGRSFGMIRNRINNEITKIIADQLNR